MTCASMILVCLIPADWSYFMKFPEISPVLIGIDHKRTIQNYLLEITEWWVIHTPLYELNNLHCSCNSNNDQAHDPGKESITSLFLFNKNDATDWYKILTMISYDFWSSRYNNIVIKVNEYQCVYIAEIFIFKAWIYYLRHIVTIYYTFFMFFIFVFLTENTSITWHRMTLTSFFFNFEYEL